MDTIFNLLPSPAGLIFSTRPHKYETLPDVEISAGFFKMSDESEEIQLDEVVQQRQVERSPAAAMGLQRPEGHDWLYLAADIVCGAVAVAGLILQIVLWGGNCLICTSLFAGWFTSFYNIGLTFCVGFALECGLKKYDLLWLHRPLIFAFLAGHSTMLNAQCQELSRKAIC